MKQLVLPNGKPVFYLDKLTALDVYREIYTDQEYFQAGIKIRDGDIVFDVGANIGLFSRYVMEHFPNCTVYAFEPVPMITEVLDANLVDYRSHVHIQHIGLSDKEEQVTFQFYPKVSADSTAVPFEWNKKVEYYVKNWDAATKGIPLAKHVPLGWRKGLIERSLKFIYKGVKVTCPLRPLSDIFLDQNINRIDLLKIDAENYEKQVIAGIRPADWVKIRQIALEVHQHIKDGETLVQDFTQFFKSQGFQVTVGKEYLAPGSGVFMLYATRN